MHKKSRGISTILGMEVDKDTLLKLASGDHRAFRSIFHAYYARIRAFAYGFLKNANETEEVVQIIFIKLWDKREMFREVEHFDAYMFTLTRHTVFNFIEAKYITPLTECEFPDLPDDSSPHDDLVASDLQLLIELTVSEMPPQRQQIYRMSRQEGLSNDEIAARLHIQKKTVENHLNLALKKLRDVISLWFITYIMLMN